MDARLYDVVIIGGGPAGLTAALYARRLGFSTAVVEKCAFGGELMNLDLIENMPGYPEGIYGPELGRKLTQQVQQLGADLILAEATGISVQDGMKICKTTEGDLISRALVVASGSRYKKLGVQGEEEFLHKGVFYCATCDGPAFIGKKVVVVGGGDSGVTEAIFMARIGVKVCIVEEKPVLTAQQYLREKVFEHNIEVKCGRKVVRILGVEGVKAVEVVNMRDDSKEILETDGICVRIGLEPNTEFLSGNLELDDQGRVMVNFMMESSIPMVFAAGNVRSYSPGQIVTAMGDGVTAAMAIQKKLTL